MAPGRVGQKAHGGTDVGHLDTGGGHIVGGLADIGHGSFGEGLGEVVRLESGPLQIKRQPGTAERESQVTEEMGLVRSMERGAVSASKPFFNRSW